MMAVRTILHLCHRIVCRSQVSPFVRLFVCESHALWVSGVKLILTVMTFQHSSMCVKCRGPQTVRYERRKSGLSTLNRVSSTKCQFRFRVLLRPFGTVSPRSIASHTSIFLDSDDVCIFVAQCPTDQKSGLFVIVDFASNKHALQETNSIVLCFVSSVCFVWSNFYCSSVSQVRITFHKEILYPPSGSNCPEQQGDRG